MMLGRARRTSKPGKCVGAPWFGGVPSPSTSGSPQPGFVRWRPRRRARLASSHLDTTSYIFALCFCTFISIVFCDRFSSYRFFERAAQLHQLNLDLTAVKTKT